MNPRASLDFKNGAITEELNLSFVSTVFVPMNWDYDDRRPKLYAKAD